MYDTISQKVTYKLLYTNEYSVRLECCIQALLERC